VKQKLIYQISIAILLIIIVVMGFFIKYLNDRSVKTLMTQVENSNGVMVIIGYYYGYKNPDDVFYITNKFKKVPNPDGSKQLIPYYRNKPCE